MLVILNGDKCTQCGHRDANQILPFDKDDSRDYHGKCYQRSKHQGRVADRCFPEHKRDKYQIKGKIARERK